MKLRRNQIISPKNFAISSGGNQKYPLSYLGNSSGGGKLKRARYYNVSTLAETFCTQHKPWLTPYNQPSRRCAYRQLGIHDSTITTQWLQILPTTSTTPYRCPMKVFQRLLHKGESLCCFRDSASVTYGGMLPSDLTLSALRFILSAKSRQSCLQDCETVDFCNSLFQRKKGLLLHRTAIDLYRLRV